MGNRIFNGAVELIQQLKERGYKIVFVTGALDFQIAPLALDLGAGVKNPSV
jgi:phosphoserine phosphatase